MEYDEASELNTESGAENNLSKGQRLREAREKQSLSYEDVVDRLNFEKRFLVALENDEHDIFPGRAYLYGYMRAYTRLLGLPVEEFVNHLKLPHETHDEVSHDLADTQLEKASNKKSWNIAVILLVVVVLFAFLFTQADDDSDYADVPDVSSPIMEPGEGDILMPEQEYLDKIEEETKNEPVTGIQPQTEQQQANVSGKTLDTDKIDVTVKPRLPNATLKLEYKNASWTDIRDGQGQRLIYRMVEKGSQLELNASPPFEILLGYSPGVVVNFNDEFFDHSHYEKEDIAYFTLSRESVASLNNELNKEVNKKAELTVVNEQPQQKQIDENEQEKQQKVQAEEHIVYELFPE